MWMSVLHCKIKTKGSNTKKMQSKIISKNAVLKIVSPQILF